MKLLPILTTIILASQIGLAFDKVSTFSNESQIRYPKQAPKLARVRLAIKLVNYRKFLVRNDYSKLKEMFRPIKPIKHHLRARIEKANHFYIDKWHIETVPMRWNRKSKNLTMKLRFYKQYGNKNKLEEAIGSTIISGHLKGQGHLYSFIGSKKIKFSNILGHPMLDVEVGSPIKSSSNISDSLKKKADQKRL